MSQKIGILIDTLSGGGAERSAGLLSKILSDLGYQVFVITLFDDILYPYSGELINLGLFKKGSQSILNKLIRYRVLRDKIIQLQFDLVLDFRMKNFPIREFLFNKLVLKTKMVNMVRSYKLDWYFPHPKILSKYLYKNYAGINVVTLDIKKEIEKKYNFNNVSTIFNPVDINYIKLKAEENLLIEDQYVTAVGRLHPVKQIVRLIEAYYNSILPQQNIKLYIIGYGPDKDLIIKKIEDLNLQTKVELLPFQDNPFKYMARAKYLILSSKNEGFPRVLVEALASGTPVVSFDCKSGPNEIIMHGKNGLLVEDQNFKMLTQACDEMITNKPLYNRCKGYSKESITKFSMENIGLEWKKYLNELQLDSNN